MQSLVHLAIVWFAVYLAVLAADRTRITPVLYYLAIGAVLVNAGILPEKSSEFIRGLAELGILIIMFALGFEEDVSNFLTSVKKSWGIAFFGAVAPFAAAYGVADFFWGDTAISMMCGLTMTATAVSLTMVSLKSEGLERSPVATRIMTSAVLDDIASLALLAVLIPVATGAAPVSFAAIMFMVAQAIAFFLLIGSIARWVLPGVKAGWLERLPFGGKLGIASLLGFDGGRHATLTVLLFALLIGLLAHAFGFHPAVGAYMAGLILKEEFFQPSGSRHSHAETRHIVELVAYSIVGPIFFIDLGTKLLFDWKILVSIIPQMVTLTVAVFIAQVASASLAARFTGALSWPASLMIGFGMLGRAELAFIVMDIAYIQNKVLTTEAFYTLMTTAFWLNVAVPLTIAWWKPHYLAHEMPTPAPGPVKP